MASVVEYGRCLTRGNEIGRLDHSTENKLFLEIFKRVMLGLVGTKCNEWGRLSAINVFMNMITYPIR